jgi:alanine racemase
VQRGLVAEVHLAALRDNLRSLKAHIGQRPLIAVVKADAYGHGMTEVAWALKEEGVECLAVAFTSEAVALREAGLRGKVLVLFDDQDVPAILHYGLSPVLHSLKAARALSVQAQRRGTEVAVHVKVDTGMGRMGLDVQEAAEAVLQIASLPGLRLQGLLSHFSDVSPKDLGYAKTQLRSFLALRAALAERGLRPLCHISSSASVALLPEAHLDAVRVGLALYGAMPFQDEQPIALKPVMKVRSHVLALRRLKKGQHIGYGRTFTTQRDSLIAVLAFGYADGYLGSLSNTAQVRINGREAPVVGRVCMDLTMADVTDVPNLREGDEVVLLGPQGPHCWQLARAAGTSPYEILTSLGGRARRVYVA